MLDCLNGAEHAQSFKCFSIMPAHQLPIQSAAVQAVDSEVVAGIINEGHAEELWKGYILCLFCLYSLQFFVFAYVNRHGIKIKIQLQFV